MESFNVLSDSDESGDVLLDDYNGDQFLGIAMSQFVSSFIDIFIVIQVILSIELLLHQWELLIQIMMGI